LSEVNLICSGEPQPLFAFRAEHKSGVFELRVLRRIVGPKGETIARILRSLGGKELYNVNILPTVLVMIT
jgi:hypothetical protein